jgi:hypothetical protein
VYVLQKLTRLRADRDDFEESKAAIESFKKVQRLVLAGCQILDVFAAD